jgi:outer membrane protein OmpA-like peptidoglycan-associated protein
MRTSLIVCLFAVACGPKGSDREGTLKPPGPPAPSGDGELATNGAPKYLEVHHDVLRLKPGTHINFSTDSAKILPDSEPVMNEVAEVMKLNPRVEFRIEGHTDNTASQDHNQTLSERRAVAVKAWLVGFGIAETRLDSLGCGENVPIADNNTEEGKAENRRVEFVVKRHEHPRGNCELYKRGG